MQALSVSQHAITNIKEIACSSHDGIGEDYIEDMSDTDADAYAGDTF